MKKLMGIALLLGCGAALGFMGCASTGGSKEAEAAAPKQEKLETPVSEGIAAIQVAYSLARYGYSNYSASALIEAAEILAQTQTQPLDAKGEAKGGAGGPAETAHPEFTPVNLLADARNFAAGDTALLEWADKVESSAGGQTRGAVGGPREGISSVVGRDSIIYKLPFRAGEPATVFVSGDGSTDLDLYVYDEKGNLIGYDEGYSDDAIVRWNPRWTGSFIIEVKNQGRNRNQFVIVTD